MRRYDDPVEVRRGMVAGPGGTQEGPEQFLWRGRLWKVCDVMAHWVETGAWWRGAGTRGGASAELVATQEVWRVEAVRAGRSRMSFAGVYDLTWDSAANRWWLVRVHD